MKKFLTRLFLFFIPVALISYPVDIFLSKNLKKSNTFAQEEYSTWNDLYAGNVDSKIVIYGSSRARTHIDPSMLGDNLNTTVYNLGIDGHTFELQYLRHLILLKKNTKPKLIIHSVDMYTLTKREELYNPDQMLPYMLWDEDIRNSTRGFKGFSYIDYYIPLVRYYGKFLAIKTAIQMSVSQSANQVQRVRGYQGEDRVWNADFEKARAKFRNYKVKLDSGVIRLFENYLNECRRNDIKLIFVYTPEYIDGQKFVENRQEVIQMYNAFSKKYSIPFFDFSNDQLSHDRRYFYNASHLNKSGAELFTNELIDVLRNDEKLNIFLKD